MTFENLTNKGDERLVDSTAIASGVITAIVSWFSAWTAPVDFVGLALQLTPGESDALVSILVAVIGGLFGLAGTALHVLLRFYVESRKKRKRRRELAE